MIFFQYHDITDGYNINLQFLELCQSESGGFGGGPGQLAHLATSYAAMHALAILGCGYFQRAYQVVNRSKMMQFLKSVKNEDGSFCMHVNGERDGFRTIDKL